MSYFVHELLAYIATDWSRYLWIDCKGAGIQFIQLQLNMYKIKSDKIKSYKIQASNAMFSIYKADKNITKPFKMSFYIQVILISFSSTVQVSYNTCTFRIFKYISHIHDLMKKDAINHPSIFWKSSKIDSESGIPDQCVHPKKYVSTNNCLQTGDKSLYYICMFLLQASVKNIKDTMTLHAAQTMNAILGINPYNALCKEIYYSLLCTVNI